jgi:sugar phosphate isomerase/epimerase
MFTLATKFAPAAERFELAFRAGFHAAEFWLNADLLAQWETVAEMAKAYPLAYALHFPNRHPLAPESLQHAVELYRALDCRVMIIHQPMWERYGKQLRRLDRDLCLAVENHKLAPDDLQRWGSENAALTLDVEHVWKYTLRDAPLASLLHRLDEFLSRFAAKVKHVHLPGYLPGWDEHRPMYCAREMIFPVLSLLAECDFDGLVVSETSLQFQNLCELSMDVLLVQRWSEFYDSSVERLRQPEAPLPIAS